MEETNEQPTLMAHAAKWGLIVGGISILLYGSLYAIDLALMVQIKFFFLIILCYLGAIIYAGIEYRNQNGRYLSYGKAFQHGFILMITGMFLGTLFNILLYHVIDPELPSKLLEASMENARAMMESFGTPADAIDDAMAKAEANAAESFTLVGQLKAFFINGIIITAVIVAITSLIVRKTEPVEL
ncbi:MAG TPA: DUF4199 domain-containing protein [Cyclobacteriaceae bacterium]|nr:DUF4199 domain-containing protein [Cyclobacteriaceae bacterium]